MIIPVLNDADGLRRCLASLGLASASRPDAEVIVVDNGSVDGSASVGRSMGATVLEVPCVRVGELRNRGAAAARGQTFAFVDADHEVVSGWYEAACSVPQENGVGAAGAPYSAPPSGTWVQAMYGRLRGLPQGRRDVVWLGSGNLVVRRSVFTDVGGFDTELDACEDVDLCQRIRAAGWRLVSDARLGSIHHGDPATLAALFMSERWRGRDNIRVSLRRWTTRGAVSAALPVVELAVIVATVGGVLAGPWIGPWLSAGGAIGISGLGVIRAARILRQPGPSGPISWLRAFAVGVTYDLARTLALVTPATHRRAKE